MCFPFFFDYLDFISSFYLVCSFQSPYTPFALERKVNKLDTFCSFRCVMTNSFTGIGQHRSSHGYVGKLPIKTYFNEIIMDWWKYLYNSKNTLLQAHTYAIGPMNCALQMVKG